MCTDHSGYTYIASIKDLRVFILLQEDELLVEAR